MAGFNNLQSAILSSISNLRTFGEEVDTGHWQGVPTEGKPDLITKELINLNFSAPIPHSADEAAVAIGPNIPWAEDHFQERVSRVPSNPGEEYKNWPWWQGQFDATASTVPDSGRMFAPHEVPFKFSHTYQERFWPKHTQADWESTETQIWPKMRGIRYDYGDLDDVVELLRREPYTRQATFPIFFPEDTGAVHGGRIPCTLHYHFLLRHGRLHLWYAIRSCDAVRHFRDDLYLACRLAQWVLYELKVGDNDYPEQMLWESVDPGMLFFTAYSFHYHMGDAHLL